MKLTLLCSKNQIKKVLKHKVINKLNVYYKHLKIRYKRISFTCFPQTVLKLKNMLVAKFSDI